MNKGELIERLSEETQMTKRDSEKMLFAAFTIIADSISKDERVQISGFGIF